MGRISSPEDIDTKAHICLQYGRIIYYVSITRWLVRLWNCKLLKPYVTDHIYSARYTGSNLAFAGFYDMQWLAVWLSNPRYRQQSINTRDLGLKFHTKYILF